MKRFRSIFMILCVVLLVSGCSLLQNKMPSDVDFKTGVHELQVSILPGTPPQTVYPHSHFKMLVQLDNQAAYDVTNGKMSIVGLDPYYIQITPVEQDVDPLEGRIVTSPAGGRDLKEFDGEVLSVGDASSYDAHFFIQTQYLSKMEYAETVCLNPSAYDIYDGGCSVKSQITYRGQGAPLAVAAMEEIVSPGDRAEVEFRFTLKNTGSGIIDFVNLE